MKELFERLTHNSNQIKAIRNSIDNVMILPYYSIYTQQEERKKDLEISFKRLKQVLNKRHTLLDNLQLEITKELAEISALQKQNTINQINEL